MQTLPLHHSGPLGGILEESERHQIVEMRLRAGNEIPPYQSPATVILITLSGSAEIHSSVDGSTTTLLPDRIISLAPLETHSIRATADNTHIIAIKSGPTA